MTTTATRYSTSEVCDNAGCTYRQLDYWCRRGLIRPSIDEGRGSGSARAWSAHDVATVKVIAAVAGKVTALNRLGQLVGFLTDLPLQQWAATTIVLDSSGDVWLASDAAPKVGLHVDLSLVFDSAA